MKARIALIDDHPLILRALTFILEAEDDFTVCGEAVDIESGKALIKKQLPDVALVDLMLGELLALDFVKDIGTLSPSTRTIVVSARDEMLFAPRCLKNGAVGYLEKSGDLPAILNAVRSAMAGEVVVSDAVQQQMLRSVGQPSETPQDVLSDRELQVFQLIGTGQTTRQIAEQLDRSVKTIESYRERIKTKLRLDNASMLSKSAFEWLKTVSSQDSSQ